MARRRLTLKRIDPWSVLKFGFVANLALLAIGLLGSGVIWFFVRQLGLVEKVCEIASDVGFVECGVNGGNLFRALLLLGLLGVVVQTGLLVFLAFLHNLISDLVGGVSFTYTEEGGSAVTPSAASTTKGAASDAERTRSYEPAGASSSGGSSTSGASSGGGSGGSSGSTPPPPLGSNSPSWSGTSPGSSTGSSSGSSGSPGSSGGSGGSSGSSWDTASGGSGSSGSSGSYSTPPSSDGVGDDWTRRSSSGDDEWSRRSDPDGGGSSGS